MAKTYYLRDKHGVMRLKMDEDMAKIMMKSDNGFFRQGHFETSSGRRFSAEVFEFDVDSVYQLAYVKIYIWEGDILIPEV